MLFNLRDFIIRAEGPWATSPLTEPLILRHADDFVEFGGPLTVNVSAEVENEFVPQTSVQANHLQRSSSSLFSYTVDIKAGYKWALAVRQMPLSALAAHGARIVIRQSPCAPEVCEPDLPCDFAVKHLPDCGCFFPSSCEPCEGGPIRMPPTCRPSLTVVPAPGGCVRPRFFNGMFITREDMETELRYFRVKNNLQRRADGEGVVWGFGLGRDGRSICVHPGYGVDCCGNDLTVTCTYKVRVTELLADPALCHRRRGERECYSLLLEYVECPEDPRPVHGEPCVGAPAGCEMSRVRETVRLRLVPERKHCCESPVSKLLKELCKPRPRDECCEDRPPREECPCLTDPCCGNEPLFPCLPPWCEVDGKGQPAGPRAVALAMVYALLAGTIATEEVSKGENPKVKAAADLFQAFVTLLSENKLGHGDLDNMAVKVRQLLADWCCSLLYPGPTCDCEIHGVVIGRAILCGDEIDSIDPWAGRRWVMHYPLMAYWGEQFGIMPPDVLASRLFDLICCVSRLEPPSCEALCSGDESREGFEFPMTGGVLRVKPGGPQRTGHRDPRVHRTQMVPLHDFSRHALAAMIAGERERPADVAFVELQLEGCPEVSLLVPDPTAPPVRAEEEPAAAERRPGAARGGPTEAEWIESLVREALDVTRTRRVHRSLPMLRAFGARLAAGLSRVLPLTATSPPPSAQLVEALERDDVVTIGDMLQRPPESLAAALEDRELVGPLSDLIQRGEARVQFVADAVVDSVKSVADQHGLVSARDLSESGNGRAALAETLGQRLSLPRESVARQVSEALT